MEILIRAKQSDNAMFDFLAFDDPLQPFFRHMVVMIKAGRFTVGAQKQGKCRGWDGVGCNEIVWDRAGGMAGHGTDGTTRGRGRR